MPVRSLNSSVLKWPDRKTVDREVRRWAMEVAKGSTKILRIGYFGSYARDDWGVGSDLDLVVIIDSDKSENISNYPDATELPVPADVLIYTQKEWEGLPHDGRFYRTVMKEIIWVYES